MSVFHKSWTEQRWHVKKNKVSMAGFQVGFPKSKHLGPFQSANKMKFRVKHQTVSPSKGQAVEALTSCPPGNAVLKERKEKRPMYPKS